MISIISSFDDDIWNDFVYNHPHGNIFQSAEMAHVYKSTKNQESISLMAFDSVNNDVLAVIQAVVISEYSSPFKYFSSRSIIMGGPLFIDNEQGIKAVNLLLKKYDEIIKKKAIYSEIRNLWDVSFYHNVFKTNDYQYSDHLNYINYLDEDCDKLWSKLRKSKRNSIAKGVKLGTKVEEVIDSSLITDVYSLLEETLHGKKPLADISLFNSVINYLVPRNMAKIWIAKNEGQIIGVVIILMYKSVLYDWYAGSSRDNQYLYPNDILPWEVIKWGHNNSYKKFDFGGAGSPDKIYGVRDFKKRFGGDEVNYGRYKKIHSKLLCFFLKKVYRVHKYIRHWL
ncbi:GNAT family N-acetyltransferase [Methanolobus vulcani]|uniref:Peptidoglycan bridge formation glycyltransferase FemA/FemB family protein n=1 Tax=Methanolobus vulcani TaxID=38026 RepID=A0A7Z8KPY8_9EURY|nr:GNAT family N-acetyltransferase [Methanolobus vulcani]TQD27260.1 peptidoglycan bridge formation glycyltransferase FemA/FemB family protein [Methanolobus vulcani]